MNKILECIPNFSEGVNAGTLNKIAAAIRAVDGVWLLHIDQSPAANRTVFTFAGTPEAVVEAAFAAIKIAAKNIDMRTQQGVHPRIGATDVCPLVPLYGMTMEEADQYAQKLGKRVGDELLIPVFMYENSQMKMYRKTLPQIRKGQYEGLKDKMSLPEWQPDYGPSYSNEKSGATVMGARDILVAFNISLQSKDIAAAQWIAKEMRSASMGKSGHALPCLRAIGWYMADYEQVQVSFNLLDYRITAPLQVWQTCSGLAAEKGIALKGSEVIGLLPEQCMQDAGRFALQEKSAEATEDDLISAAIKLMGLAVLKPFRPEEKILERVLEKHCSLNI